MEFNTIEVVTALEDAVATLDGTSRTNNRREDSIPTGSVKSHTDRFSRYYKTPPPEEVESFSAIKRSGRIKVTDYEHSKMDITYPLVRIPHLVENRAFRGETPCESYRKDTDTKTGRYDEVTNFNLELENGTVLWPYIIKDSEDALQEVLGNVISDASSTLDLLTEFAERSKTIELILELLGAVRRPIQSFKDSVRHIRRTVKNPLDAADKLADLWLKFRYGIMPLIYAIEDALEVLENQDRIYASHRSSQITHAVFQKGSGDRKMVDTGSHSIRYRAFTKARLAGSHINVYTLLGISPARTAWELIPFSFVVDWFINVGDFIEAKLFSMFDLAEERAFCVSVKTETDIKTMLHYPGMSVPEQDVFSSGCNKIVHTYPENSLPAGSAIIRTIKEDSYVRTVVHPGDLDLDLNPFLDWKRWLDSISLGIRNLKQSLRRLR